MQVLNKDFLRFEYVLDQCKIVPVMAHSRISHLRYLQSRSDDELDNVVKREMCTSMLKLHYDAQLETDWQYVNKPGEVELYAQVFILNRRRMGELLTAMYLEGVRDANQLRI